MQNLRFMAIMLLVGIGFASDASAQPPPGEILQIGTTVVLPDGRTVPSNDAVLVDASTGQRHAVYIDALEFDNAPGRGRVTLATGGGGVRWVCSANSGGFPGLGEEVPTPRCGTASGQSVSIDRCRATISVHARAHIDDPYTPFSGGTTVDISFNRTAAGGADGMLTVTVHTPKKELRLQGTVTGTVNMPTCNF